MTHGNGNSTPTAHTRIENLLRKALAVAHFAASATVTPQASWTQPAWFVDPSNVTGLASDQNDGKTALKPVRTWNGGVLRKLDTYSPRLRQNTTITFLSDHTDNSDPVVFRPFIENGALVIIQGALPVPVAVGALGGVVAKNRATNTLLQATLPAGAAVGQMLVNTTRNARCFLYKDTAGTWTLSQPYAPQTIPLGLSTQVNTFANGDAVQLFRLTNVNLVDVTPELEDLNLVTFANQLAIYQLSIFDAGGAFVGKCAIGPDVNIVECDAVRMLAIAPTPSLNGCGIFNSSARGSIVGGAPESFGTNTTQLVILGGFSLILATVTNARFDGDVIAGGDVMAYDCAIGTIAIDTGHFYSAAGTTSDLKLGALGGAIAVYGGGTYNSIGSCRTAYPAGAGGGVATFPISPRLQINGGTTAHSVIVGAPDVFNGGIATTAANLDAAAGAAGFGGNAFNPGGASIVNLTE